MSFSTLVILVCTEKPLQHQPCAHKMDQGMEFWISLVWVQEVFAHHTHSPISFCFARNMLSMLIYAAMLKAAFPQRRVNNCLGCCCWNLEVWILPARHRMLVMLYTKGQQLWVSHSFHKFLFPS